LVENSNLDCKVIWTYKHGENILEATKILPLRHKRARDGAVERAVLFVDEYIQELLNPYSPKLKTPNSSEIKKKTVQFILYYDFSLLLALQLLT
jgi:hypothetical protein